MIAKGLNMPKTRRRGVTLTEAVLFIAIALGLIVAGLVFFQQASLASRMSTQTRLLSALVSETRAIYQLESNFDTVTTAPIDIAPVLVAAGAVPPSNIRRNPGVGQSPIIDAWGNGIVMRLRLEGGQIRIDLAVEDPPPQACVRLAVVDARGSSIFSNGVASVTFYDNTASFPITLPRRVFAPVTLTRAAAADACRPPTGQRRSLQFAVFLFI
jgi:hypothetical protein